MELPLQQLGKVRAHPPAMVPGYLADRMREQSTID
jgi:hypothetical protein